MNFEFEGVELQEFIELIYELNQEIYEQTGDEGIMLEPLNFMTDGNSAVITFMGSYRVWSSEDNEREFIEEQNDWEPLEDYLRREMKAILNTICSIKI